MNARSAVALVLAVLILSFGASALAAAQADAPAADAEDPALQAHVAYLVKMLESPNRIIRDSAHQGLVAVGKPALPAVEAAAAKATGKAAEVAARTLKALRSKLARIDARSAEKAAAGDEDARRRPAGPSESDIAAVLTGAGIDATLAGAVKAALEARRIALEELKKEAAAGLDPAVLKDKRAAVARAFRGKLEQILGPEQAKKFQKALGQRRADGDASDGRRARDRSDRADGQESGRA
ncbi:MAG: hypothetical protein JXQ29_13235 [Planctomycetes bacterium]|nr:hypothetical protein [Planctomycetota bacterium]